MLQWTLEPKWSLCQAVFIKLQRLLHGPPMELDMRADNPKSSPRDPADFVEYDACGGVSVDFVKFLFSENGRQQLEKLQDLRTAYTASPSRPKK